MAILAVEARAQDLIPPTGFQELYQRYADAVFRTALRVTGNAADAEDVLQSVFLKFLDHEVMPDPIRSPESYLRRAASNAAIDLLRRRGASPESPMAENRDYASPADRPLEKERVRRALARLDPEDAELFVMCYLEGFSYEELAEQYGVAKGTVASRLYRIRADLQKFLSK
jgi:RNA polymerase sigma-70 factor (ECF subfamily)